MFFRSAKKTRHNALITELHRSHSFDPAKRVGNGDGGEAYAGGPNRVASMPPRLQQQQQQQQQHHIPPPSAKRPVVALTDQQFDSFMSYVRTVLEERKDLDESRLDSANEIPRTDGLVPVKDTLAVIAPAEDDDKEEGEQKETVEDDNDNPKKTTETPIPVDSRGLSSEKEASSRQGETHEQVGDEDEDMAPVHKHEAAISSELTSSIIMTDSQRLQQIETTLNEDTFSFVISAPVVSGPFLTGILVFLIKTLLYGLTLIDLMNILNGFDVSANIPVAVDSLVFYTQFIALCIAVLTQNDMIISLKLLYEGFGRNKVGAGICDAFPHATYPKWLFAVILLFFEGLLGLLATLFLTITSTTILDVLLNFAAVEFISSLDDSAFYLASIGYLGRANRLEAETIAATAYPLPHKMKPAQQIGLLMMIMVMTVASWAGVATLQLQGNFAPGSFYVQFDDSIRRQLGTHSGIYKLGNPPLSATDFLFNRGRFRYEEQLSKGNGKFDYCYATGSWTFFVEGDNPCENVLATADPLDTYDITETGSGVWSALRLDGKAFVPFDNFYLSQICAVDDDCGTGGSCNGDGMCDCEAGFVGTRCDYGPEELCPELILDELTSTSFAARRQLATSYELLRNTETNEVLTAYDRPIYFNNETQDVIVYSGLRWIVMNPVYGGAFNVTDSEGILGLETTDYHASTDTGLVDAVGAPVFYNSGQDSSSPALLEWFSVLNSATLIEALLTTDRIATFLLCARCDDTLNPCTNNSPCVEGKCECQHGELGASCQVLPTGDGQCNAFFNSPVYDYDNGDCCGLTCTSGRHPCRSISLGDLVLPTLGFPDCVNPSLTSHCSGRSDCFVRASDTTQSFFPPPSFMKAITLWNNGRIIAVGEQGRVSSIRVVKEFSSSVETEMIELGPSQFRVKASSPPGNIKSTNAGTIPRGVIAYNVGTNVIQFASIGSVRQTLSQDSPLFLSDFGIDGGDGGIGCGVLEELGVGIASLELDGQAFFSITLAVRLRDVCSTVLPVDTNVTAPTNTSILAASNTHLFYTTSASTGWSHVPIGLWDDVAVSGTGFYIALHDKSMGIGENISVRLGVLSRSGSIVPLLNFSLKERLSGLLDGTSTNFTSLDAMQLSHGGHELSIAVSAVNLTTQEPFGVVVKMLLATGPAFQPIAANPVFPVAFTDAFPAFSGSNTNRSCLPGQTCDVIVFSGDGSSFAFLVPGENKIDVYTTEQNYGLQYRQWKFVASFFGTDHGVTDIQKFALSTDGSTLIVGSTDGTAKFDLQEPCQANERPLYLSVVLDDNPSSVSWSVESLFKMNGMTYVKSIVRDCAGCYPEEQDYPQTTVVDVVCVPRDMEDCLGLKVDIAENKTLTSAIAYYNNNTVAESLLFFRGDGESVSANGHSASWQSPTCGNTVTRSCAGLESLYVQSITFTRLEGSMWWAITSNSTGVTAMNRTVGQRDVNDVDSLVYDEVCVASDDCWVVSFGGGSFALSYVMGVVDGGEVQGSGAVPVWSISPTLSFGSRCV